MNLVFQKFPLGRNGVEEGFYGPGADSFGGPSPRQVLFSSMIHLCFSIVLWKVGHPSVDKCLVIVSHMTEDLGHGREGRFSKGVHIGEEMNTSWWLLFNSRMNGI